VQSESEIRAEIEKLFAELSAIGKRLQEAIDHASKNMWVRNNLVVSGLKQLHDTTTARSDEILTRIEELQEKLAEVGKIGKP
jgi:hypothetical protein